MTETNSAYTPQWAQVASAPWRPSVDVYRCGSDWLVKCDLAGVRREEICVSTAGSALTIEGLRRDWTLVQGHRVYSMEIVYDRFRRVIELPCTLDEATIELDYREGMLFIAIGNCGSETGCQE